MYFLSLSFFVLCFFIDVYVHYCRVYPAADCLLVQFCISIQTITLIPKTAKVKKFKFLSIVSFISSTFLRCLKIASCYLSYWGTFFRNVLVFSKPKTQPEFLSVYIEKIKNNNGKTPVWHTYRNCLDIFLHHHAVSDNTYFFLFFNVFICFVTVQDYLHFVSLFSYVN